ncbi:hypothetical protein LB534_05070 [Mesorhizobium sp. CA18]|uniref:hypothetical protein n=1 Tax=unclassified Mesorhizobium TaxID=325217 RepID=UPI001CD02161|nr:MULTISPECIES: hypothetical protein [unclassified Mesorhizobium]MBZ9734367.1 hypothetical protein [Mesorhizobium sp. CA9]MBZ9824648.1 hypothetical protein [Mesorhizobium sp. CA18]MBZ9829394.1 hypothetical protein [Mesorhizobium sp. CA2]MBZ9878016.1 hypothetical protein [Mesorhizobium sp. Ca11]MBZ9902894.1 hypothetical protein [Mesorhizobium sp. CA17]
MNELTPEAKDAIRTYMLKFVIPSSVLLTIISGSLGYVVSGLARIDASSEAAKYAMMAAGEAAKANANATVAASEAADSKDKAQNASKDALATKAYLESVKGQVDKVMTGQYGEFATALFAIPDFRSSVGKLGQNELVEIDARLDALELRNSNTLTAFGIIRNSTLVAGTNVSYDPASGIIAFANPSGVAFVPLASAVQSTVST